MKSKELKKNYEKNKKIILPLILLAFIAVIWVVQPKGEPVDFECPIEYGEAECISGKIHIPFYNPNKNDITSVSVSIASGEDKDIFNVDSPLLPDKPEVLIVGSCQGDVDMKKFELSWCCGDACFDSKMNATSDELSLKK